MLNNHTCFALLHLLGYVWHQTQEESKNGQQQGGNAGDTLHVLRFRVRPRVRITSAVMETFLLTCSGVKSVREIFFVPSLDEVYVAFTYNRVQQVEQLEPLDALKKLLQHINNHDNLHTPYIQTHRNMEEQVSILSSARYL